MILPVPVLGRFYKICKTSECLKCLEKTRHCTAVVTKISPSQYPGSVLAAAADKTPSRHWVTAVPDAVQESGANPLNQHPDRAVWQKNNRSFGIFWHGYSIYFGKMTWNILFLPI